MQKHEESLSNRRSIRGEGLEVGLVFSEAVAEGIVLFLDLSWFSLESLDSDKMGKIPIGKRGGHGELSSS